MELSTCNQILLLDLNRAQTLLERPVLGEGFLAGLTTDSKLWRIFPFASVAEFTVSTRKYPGAKNLLTRNQNLAEHLQQLIGQVIKVESSDQQQKIATLIEVSQGLIWLKDLNQLLAIPLEQVTSIWLWKNISGDSQRVPAFSETEGQNYGD